MGNIRERVEYIDTAAGIMILWLLWYHALWPLYEREVLSVVPWFFYFMPWFFYKSGYFFSPKPIREVVRKDSTKLLKQYAIWSIIGYALYIVQLFYYSDTITFREVVYSPLRNLIFIGAVPINRSLWFIPVLCVVHILTISFTRIPTWYEMANQLPWYEYVGWFPASLAGCIVLNTICRWIDKWPISIFKWIGRHSMIFYVVQGVDCVLIADWLFYMHREYYSSWWCVLAAFVLYAVTIIPLSFVLDIRRKSIKKV